MRIDLRKDRGILEPVKFSTGEYGDGGLSDDEQIVATLKRRHGVDQTEPEIEVEASSPEKKSELRKKRPKKGAFRVFVLTLIMMAVVAYYLDQQSLLKPGIKLVSDYWCEMLGISKPESIEPWYVVDDSMIEGDGFLSEELFNELMPMSDEVAALLDSIGTEPADSSISDQRALSEADDQDSAFLPVAEEPIQLTDEDIVIINNRSLLLMLTELLNVYPEDVPDGHIFLKRDGLTMRAPSGGNWVEAAQMTLDKFVLGNYMKDYSRGNAVISSKFEIIMNAEQDFQAQVLDGLRLLDVLAHPFTDYLDEIRIDLAQGVNNNPAVFTFNGSRQEIQYIMSSWAESRTNFRLTSVDIDFKADQLFLKLDVTFFNYLQ